MGKAGKSKRAKRRQWQRVNKALPPTKIGATESTMSAGRVVDGFAVEVSWLRSRHSVTRFWCVSCAAPVPPLANIIPPFYHNRTNTCTTTLVPRLYAAPVQAQAVVPRFVRIFCLLCFRKQRRPGRFLCRHVCLPFFDVVAGISAASAPSAPYRLAKCGAEKANLSCPVLNLNRFVHHHYPPPHRTVHVQYCKN